MTTSDFIPIEITLITSATGPVNKRIWIDEDGKIQKKGVALISAGEAWRLPLKDWRCLAQVITRLAPNQAICLGRLAPHIGAVDPRDGFVKAYLTTSDNMRELALPNRFPRITGNLIYTPGVPAPCAIDFDVAGMPETVRERIKNAGGLIGALTSICPGIVDASYVSRASTSAGLDHRSNWRAYRGREPPLRHPCRWLNGPAIHRGSVR
jgi:hypothetical protein